MHKQMEHQEHAQHAAHGGSQNAALLVAMLAAALAITEQGAKHAEIRVQENSIMAADLWNEYQAKSVRSTVARDVAELAGAMEFGSPEATKRRDAMLERLRGDQQRYDHDPKNGRDALSQRARALEHERDHSLEQTHSYHNGAALFELGIVLSTASAITQARLLFRMAVALGVIGLVFAALGYVEPEWGAL